MAVFCSNSYCVLPEVFWTFHNNEYNIVIEPTIDLADSIYEVGEKGKGEEFFYANQC